MNSVTATLVALGLGLGCSRQATILVDGPDGGDAGLDSGIPVDPLYDAGIDCSQHCIIDGGSYCANAPDPVFHADALGAGTARNTCFICDPSMSTDAWTELPADAGCDSNFNPGRGSCYIPTGFGPAEEFCGCVYPPGFCNKDMDCCVGVCVETQQALSEGLVGECRSRPGDLCNPQNPEFCLSDLCCYDPTLDGGQEHYTGRCAANGATSCPQN